MAAKKKTTKSSPPARRRILSTLELAEELGVSTRTVDNYRAEGCPTVGKSRKDRSKRNRFDVADVRRWMLEKGRTGELGGSPPVPGVQTSTDPDLAAHRCRKEKELADKYALENAIKRAELIHRREVAAAGVAKTTVLRTRLLRLADTMPPELRGLEERAIRERLLAQFEQICRDFGAGIDGTPPTVQDLEDAARLLALIDEGEQLVVRAAQGR